MDNSNLQKKIEKGIDYFNKKLFDKSIAEFEEIIEKKPYQIDALHWIGCIKLIEGDLNQALKYLMQAYIRLLSDEENISKEFKSLLLSHLGRVHHLAGNYSYAFLLYKKAQKENGNNNANVWINQIANTSEEGLAKAEEEFQFSLVELMIKNNLTKHALKIIERLIEKSPDNQNYMHYKAVILHLEKNTAEAEKLMRETVVNEPKNKSFRINYANVLRALGKNEEAKKYYFEVLKEDNKNADALNNLGNIYLYEENYAEARKFYEKAIESSPTQYQTLVNLGTIELKNLNFESAEKYYLDALIINSNDLVALNNLSVIYKELGKLDLAVKMAKKVLDIDNLNAEAWTNLGNNYRLLGNVVEAEAAYKNAYEIKPADAIVVSNYGNYFGDTNRIDKALIYLKKAIELDPKLYSSWNNIGAVYLRMGNVKEAAQSFIKSYELNNENYGAISNYLLSLNYTNEYNGVQLKEIHAEWCNKLFKNKKIVEVKKIEKLNIKSIKLGIVSADFRRHSVALFMECLYKELDKNCFKIYSYSNGVNNDEYTEFFKDKSTCWREIFGVSDFDVAKIIKEDEIDILIDVGGFTNNNRLGVFSYKPAPIQATWLGYVATTGLEQMDYRIVDWNTDPIWREKDENSERLIRLSRILQCYSPTANAKIEIPKFPDESDAVIFGCFNNFAKITDKVLEVWGKILSSDKRFQLYLKSVGAENKETQDKVIRIIQNQGANADQLKFAGQMNDSIHLKEFSKIHIALDPYPFNGATTTFETLYMGVPIVALEGKSSISRMSSSILKNLGMNDWIASDEEQYIDIAIKKASNIEELKNIRKTLRGIMEKSAVMDSSGFALDFQSAMYQMIDLETENE